MRRRSQAGVTLMELLIAVSLVSLISVSALMAMRVGFNAMRSTNDKIIANRRALGTQKIIEQQVAGMIVTMAECTAGGPPVKIPFFQGEPQTMRFVSTYSLQEAHRGYPRILEYQVIPRPDGNGVRLVVNEMLYSGPRSAGRVCIGPGPPGLGNMFVPVQIGATSFILADNLAFCRFGFLQEAPPPVWNEWVPVFSDKKFPLAVRVEMAPTESPRGRIPLLSMIAPVRVNRLPGVSYADAMQMPQ
jgi:prepilin-type N-terminal cleavage/methylation domain-containing protein